MKWLSSAAAGVAAFGLAVFLQWLIYDDWMHANGPLRLVGSVLVGLLTFAFVSYARLLADRRRFEAHRRSEAIRLAHDRVRNSLQTIECVTYAYDPQSTDPVRDAVDAIERTLEEAVKESEVSLPHVSRGGTAGPDQASHQ